MASSPRESSRFRTELRCQLGRGLGTLPTNSRRGGCVVIATATTSAASDGVTLRAPRTSRSPRSAMRPFTTPGALRFGLVVLVTGTLLFGIVATRSVIERLDAAHAVGHVATPQLVASQDVYASLADADATASSAFLDAARETHEIQARYRADLDNASQQLADMARRSGSAQARAAVTTMTNELPVYADLVANAHANSLQALLV